MPDRADAAQALGDEKGNDAVVAALGEAALHDRFWGVRNEALLALGRIGGSEAEKRVLAATANSEPWVREMAVASWAVSATTRRWPRGSRKCFAPTPPIACAPRRWSLWADESLPARWTFWRTRRAPIRPTTSFAARRCAPWAGLGDDRSARTLLDWSAQGKPVAPARRGHRSLGPARQEE